MEQDNTSFTLTKAELSALCSHASKDVTRRHLCGIAVCPDGAIFSTDGHRLLLGRKSDPNDRKQFTPLSGPVVLPLETMQAIAKASKKNDSIRFGLTADEATAWASGASFAIKYTGEKPPPYLQVLPQVARGQACGAPAVNARYLADLAPLAASFDDRNSGIVIASGSELDVLTVYFTGSDDWTAIIMPMRHEKAWSYMPNRERSAA